MRYLAIDLGDKRTGLALSEDEPALISPLKVFELPPGHTLIEAIERVIRDHQPNAIVIGLPLNMDDSEGPQAKKVRDFAAQLTQRVELPVHFQDERLTSFAAEEQIARTGRTYKQKKQLRDALAAVEILRDFLNARK